MNQYDDQKREFPSTLISIILANLLCFAIPITAPVIIVAEVVFGVRRLRSQKTVGYHRLLAVTMVCSGITVFLVMGSVLALSLGGEIIATVEAGTPYFPIQVPVESTLEVER